LSERRASPWLQLVLIGSMAALLNYFAARLLSFLLEDYPPLEKAFAAALLFAETFVLVHALGYAANVLRVLMTQNRPKPSRKEFSRGDHPRVAVLVAARHEPRDVLERTFAAIRRMEYPPEKMDVYFLDDSSEEKYRSEAEQICAQMGLKLFRRDVRHGAKAGIVNDCLAQIDHPYVAIFDADQCPTTGFLTRTLGFLEENPRLAVVQTPQFYTNIGDSRVGRAAGFQQAVFYEYICEGKSSSDAMICCGTNVVLRTAALRQIGGLDESTVTEDFATSYKLHSLKWKTLYDGHVSVFGMGPEDLGSYFKQQFRWAKGSLSVFRWILRDLFLRPFSLSLGQRLEYFVSGSYYLIGWAFFFLMICPIVYLFFGVPSFLDDKKNVALMFVPYITLSTILFYVFLRQRSYRPKDLLLGQLLATVSFSVLMRAGAAALLGVKTSFGITGKNKAQSLPYRALWPQITMLVLSWTGFVWGLNRFFYDRHAATAVNTFWALYHCALLSSLFYFNETGFSILACRLLPRKVKFDCRVVDADARLGPLDLSAWPEAFKARMPVVCRAGAKVLCSLTPRGESSVVFEGQVLETRSSGREATIGVVAATPADREKLQRMLRK